MQVDHRFTIKILVGMGLGIALGLIWKILPISMMTSEFIIQSVAGTFGSLFIHLIKLIVVPLVFISLVCGVCYLGEVKKLGPLAIKSIAIYLMTTMLAIIIALTVASLFHIGAGLHLKTAAKFIPPQPLSLSQVIINFIPENPIRALAEGNMIQIIVFALLVGLAVVACGDQAKGVVKGFQSANEVMMKLILMVMSLAPYGVFFLLFKIFSVLDFNSIGHLIGYFFTVVLVLALQFVFIYGGLLWGFCKQGLPDFIQKIHPALLFAFSTSSSNATIPVTLKTVRERLGVNHSIASFVVPLGATINMDGTAIMQGVATVFIANAYHLSIGFSGYLMVVLMATLASIGTAGVPGVGLITLSMVLEQVGLPVSGIALILGVDRLLDMMRTAVNVTGDTMVSKMIQSFERA